MSVMKKHFKKIAALLVQLARALKAEPDQPHQELRKQIADLLAKAEPREILRVCDELIVAGFTSTSASMEPDGRGGTIWNPVASQIFCDAFFRLAEVVQNSQMQGKKDVCWRITQRGMNLSTITSFCRRLELNAPPPNLLTFKGRNEAGKMYREKMPELTKMILSFTGQARELEQNNRGKAAAKARLMASKLNAIYKKMDKNVFLWLDRKDPNVMTIGKAIGVHSGSSLAEMLRQAAEETKK